jgi:DNA-binding transcriptional regulator YiaG
VYKRYFQKHLTIRITSMSNIAQVLKSEIVRLSRKEVKSAVHPLRSSTFLLRKIVADLKKRIGALESENKRLSAIAQKEQARVSPDIAEKVRISSRGVRILRTKLGLSQDSFAKLLGVSSQAVYSMEHKQGRLRLRQGTLSSLISLRGIGKREAKRKLEELQKK